jgi:hypothetical protein
VRDAEPRRAAGQRGAGALDRAVTVPVLFHDRHDLGARAQPVAERCHVRGDNAEIYVRLPVHHGQSYLVRCRVVASYRDDSRTNCDISAP